MEQFTLDELRAIIHCMEARAKDEALTPTERFAADEMVRKAKDYIGHGIYSRFST